MLELSLEHITVWDAPVPEIVTIAADLGCGAISLFLQSTEPDRIPVPALVGDTPLRRQTLRALADTGVRVHTLECFALAADTRVEDYRAALESGARLGGRAATAIFFDPDPARACANFARLCEIGAEYGLGINAEFIALSTLPSLADAMELIRQVAQPNAGITADALHLYRSGGSPAELARAGDAIRFAQICDGPRVMSPELQLMHEGFEQRVVPGDGVFPLLEFVRALPAGITLGVEVPQKREREDGMSPRVRARRAVEATQRVLARALDRGPGDRIGGILF